MTKVLMAPTGKHLDVTGLSSEECYELMELCGGRKVKAGFRVRLDPSLIAILTEQFPAGSGTRWGRGVITWMKTELGQIPKSAVFAQEALEEHPRWSDLKGYQQVGVRWLLEHDRGMLCDQMGLGKTIQTVVATELSNKARRVLVICPNYAKDQWRDEVELWAKDGSREVFVVPSSKEQPGAANRMEVWNEFIERSNAQRHKRHYIVMHWEAVRLMKELVGQQWWDWVVIDEAHHMKNRRAQRTKALHGVWGSRIVLLTGTPIINRPDELWSLLHMLFPGKYRSYWRFYNAFVKFWRSPKGYDRVQGTKNERVLRKLVSVITLRRLRNEVLPELPPVVSEIYRSEMTDKQRRLYIRLKHDVLVDLKKALGETGKGRGVLIPNALARGIKLLQAASSTVHFEDRAMVISGGLYVGGGDSGKFDAVRDYVVDRLEEGEKIVVFCRFVLSAELIVQRLKNALGAPAQRWHIGAFHGATSNDAFVRFRDGDGDVLVCTYGVAKEAVNLQEAGIVVLAELPWSFAELEQAVARADRIGQKRKAGVVCAIFMSKGTLDEHVWKVVQRKRKIAKTILILTEALSAELGLR